MRIYKWALLWVALMISMIIIMIPAHYGITLPDLQVSEDKEDLPEDLRTSMIYNFFDMYFILFVLFNITPFMVFVLWSLYIRLRERNRGRKEVSHGIKGSDLFEEEKYPKVTIIIPCFNEERNIGFAIKDSFRQNYPGEIEIIVVDDGSKDNTYSIGKIFKGKINKRSVRIFHKQNAGKSSALFLGGEKATGKFIVTTDGDSTMDINAVMEIIDTFRRYPDAGIVGGFISIKNAHTGYLTKVQQLEYIITQQLIRLNQSDDGSVLIAPGPIFGIRADLAKIFPPLNRTIVEDCDLTMSILSTGFTTRSTMRAISYTMAPTTWEAWLNQRKRWIYGQFQAWRENKWHLKNNYWGLYTYFTWVTTTISAFIMMVTFIVTFLFLLSGNDFYSFLEFISIRGLIITSIYFLTRLVILISYKDTRSLIHYLPAKILYDLINGFLTAYLYTRYIMKLGVKMKWGNRYGVVY